MKISKHLARQITKSESFSTFFSEALDKRLQYAELDELARFVFGSLDNAIEAYIKEEGLDFLLKRPRVLRDRRAL
jgi:hypothetical protein